MKKIIFPLLLALFAMTACEPEEIETPDTPQHDTTGPADPDTTAHGTARWAYVLSEGQWGMNNAEISRLNLETGQIEAEWFSQTNGRGLGDVAQDLVRYGSRLYCTVWNSNTLEVIDTATGTSQQVSLGNRGPRYIAAHGGKLYISCYDKTVVRIDTATLQIEATCPLSGMQPEDLCIVGESIVVCNGWQYAPDGTTTVYDSTVSVVSVADFVETARLTVGKNPNRIIAVNDSMCVVACSGDYEDHAPCAKLFNIRSGEGLTLTQSATGMCLHDGQLYHYVSEYDSQYRPVARFYRTDLHSLQSTAMLENVSLNYAYGIDVDPETGDMYVSVSPYNANGDVVVFTPSGSRRWQAEAGMFCKKVVF